MAETERAAADLAYANGAFIAGADGYPPRWEAEAAAFRDSLGARARHGLAVNLDPSALILDMVLTINETASRLGVAPRTP